ncbi:MAG: GFA family protein [Thiobacillus sp.]
MYTGGCLCGSVRFEITGPIHDIVYCHCSQCRKAQGSAFATNGIVMARDFKLLSGADALSAFESSPGQTKYFCKTCGSPVLSRTASRPEQVRVRVGTIESDIVEQPIAHIFATSKANWETIAGDLPQHEAYEPGRNAPEHPS